MNPLLLLYIALMYTSVTYRETWATLIFLGGATLMPDVQHWAILMPDAHQWAMNAQHWAITCIVLSHTDAWYKSWCKLSHNYWYIMHSIEPYAAVSWFLRNAWPYKADSTPTTAVCLGQSNQLCHCAENLMITMSMACSSSAPTFS